MLVGLRKKKKVRKTFGFLSLQNPWWKMIGVMCSQDNGRDNKGIIVGLKIYHWPLQTWRGCESFAGHSQRPRKVVWDSSLFLSFFRKHNGNDACLCLWPFPWISREIHAFGQKLTFGNLASWWNLKECFYVSWIS